MDPVEPPAEPLDPQANIEAHAKAAADGYTGSRAEAELDLPLLQDAARHLRGRYRWQPELPLAAHQYLAQLTPGAHTVEQRFACRNTGTVALSGELMASGLSQLRYSFDNCGLISGDIAQGEGWLLVDAAEPGPVSPRGSLHDDFQIMTNTTVEPAQVATIGGIYTVTEIANAAPNFKFREVSHLQNETEESLLTSNCELNWDNPLDPFTYSTCNASFYKGEKGRLDLTSQTNQNYPYGQSFNDNIVFLQNLGFNQ